MSDNAVANAVAYHREHAGSYLADLEELVRIPSVSFAGFPAEEVGSFTAYEPGGCKNCNDRGYRGRVAVYEVMPMWDGLKELVINGSSAAELKQEAIRLGFRTLRMSALQKVKDGMTSLAEAIGNTAPDKF